MNVALLALPDEEWKGGKNKIKKLQLPRHVRGSIQSLHGTNVKTPGQNEFNYEEKQNSALSDELIVKRTKNGLDLKIFS